MGVRERVCVCNYRVGKELQRLSECVCVCSFTSIFVRTSLSLESAGYFWKVRTFWQYSNSSVGVKTRLKLGFRV